MYDAMEPLVQFSPLAGRLVEEIIPGAANKEVEYENDLTAADGADRTMFGYAPKSGCPDPKQTQVLFVLRDGRDKASAQAIMEELELDKLAEDQHFLLLFPNPTEAGWNADGKADMDYLDRCFAQLRGASLKVNGFNGMLFYIATTPAASALLADMMALRPGTMAATMLAQLPEGYALPEKALGVECAAWCPPGAVAEYLKKANAASDKGDENGIAFFQGKNPEVRLFVSGQAITAQMVCTAWEKLFGKSRRWQNDVYGHYHTRTDFTARGFAAHFKDTSLGVNDGFAHTWYEYIPPQLRDTTEKVPLVFYFHGVNCVPLYGAEQSCWHDIADRENFIVVYPAPAIAKSWNIYNLPIIPSDFAFVLALIEHMKQVHPIDESRIYLSGFSMGGMMSHALSAAYPEKFAAAAPNNAFAFNRYNDPVKALSGFLRDIPPEKIGHTHYSAIQADEKKAANPALRMPIFQTAGDIDGLIASWPVTAETDDIRSKTIRFWQDYNNIPQRGLDSGNLSGLAADETRWQDEEKRYQLQSWTSADDSKLPLLQLVIAQRMPHAVDLVEIQWSWEYMKHFSRAADGTLLYQEK